MVQLIPDNKMYRLKQIVLSEDVNCAKQATSNTFDQKLHEKQCFQYYILFKRVLLEDKKCIFILFYMAIFNLFFSQKPCDKSFYILNSDVTKRGILLLTICISGSRPHNGTIHLKQQYKK